MTKLIARFLDLNDWIKLIFCFCLLGAFANGVSVARDVFNDGVLLRLHAGFFILYAGQVVFILLQERHVWALAALQGVLALLTNADFTFIPFVRFIGNIIYICWPEPSLEYTNIYRYIMISLSFTLQMLGAFALFSLLPAPLPKVSNNSSAQ